MAIFSKLLIFLFVTVGFVANAQLPNLHLNRMLKENPELKINTAVQLKRGVSVASLKKIPELTYKYTQGGWHHVYLALHLLEEIYQNGTIENIYFQFDRPVALADSMRKNTNIDSVHAGYAPLQHEVKGKGVVFGFVDSGLDFNHEDFKLDNGESRVLYFWDHQQPFDAQRTPSKYGYGQVWTKADIDAQLNTTSTNDAHGATVTGVGAGNGRATGYNQGVAPEADLIIIRTDFSKPNWSLTIADAADFVFSMADTLGMPSVLNASLGGYLNSHDGLDPAAQYIDSLLTDKNGRAFVCAAGNSGHMEPYHVRADVTADTNFTWLDVNMNSAFSNDPAAYMDLWSDSLDFVNVEFAIGADATQPFVKSDRTDFHTLQDVLNAGVIYDTIYNDNGDRIAPVEISGMMMNGVFNLNVLILNPDSTDYYYRFMTTGNGMYDLWTAEWMGISKIPTEPADVPDIIDFPDMAFYEHPDTLQSIVGYWACSDKVITVGNFENSYSYIDWNGDEQINQTPPGTIAFTSSRGPTRTGILKPDVAACGNYTHAAAPLDILDFMKINDPIKVEVGGMHIRNGGTSMASPIVAGLAVLILERCSNASWEQIQDLIFNHAFGDNFTSTLPNYRWGRGKINGFQTMKSTTFEFSIAGDTAICDGVPVPFTTQGVFSNIVWHDGSTSSAFSAQESDTVFATAFDQRSCKMESDTIVIREGTTPNPATVNPLANGLLASPAFYYQWLVDGDSIPNQTGQFYIPIASGSYSAILSDEVGCWVETAPYEIDYSQIDFWNENQMVVFPNPFESNIYLLGDTVPVQKVELTDMSGKLIFKDENPLFENGLYAIKGLNVKSGVYFFRVYREDRVIVEKVVKP